MCTQPPAPDMWGSVRLYEITNPSDAYTVRGPRVMVVLAGVLLGGGKYGVEDVATGENVLPIMLLANEQQVNDWLEQFKREAGITGTIGEFLRDHAAQMVDVFESVLIGPPGDREVFETMLAEIPDGPGRDRARAAYHDAHRSSMNDIGRAALEYVVHYRKIARGEIKFS